MKVALNTLVTLLATILTRALGLAAFFLSRRWLGPQLTGVWSLTQTITSYLMAVNSGVILGAEREIPYWRGKKDAEKETAARQQLFTSAFLEGTVLAGLTLAFAAAWGDRYSPEFRQGLFWISLYILLWRLSEAYLISLRTMQEFVFLGRAQSALSVMDLLWVVLLVPRLSLTGQFMAFALGLFLRLSVFFLVVRSRAMFRLQWRLRWDAVKPLMAAGFPLMLNAFLWQWFVSADSLIVAKNLGLTALGLYSLGLSAGRMAEELPAAFSMVIFPRLMERFGSDEDIQGLGNYMHRCLQAAVFCLVPGVITLLYFLIPFAVRHYLTDFLPSLKVVKILILGGIFTSLIHIPAQVFIAQGNSLWVPCVTLGACFLKTGAAWALSAGGASAVALGVLAVHAVFFSVFVSLALYRTLGKKPALRRYLELAAGLLYCVAVLTGVDHWLVPAPGASFKQDALLTLGAMALAMLLQGVLFWRAEREIGLWARFRKIWPKPAPQIP